MELSCAAGPCFPGSEELYVRVASSFFRPLASGVLDVLLAQVFHGSMQRIVAIN